MKNMIKPIVFAFILLSACKGGASKEEAYSEAPTATMDKVKGMQTTEGNAAQPEAEATKPIERKVITTGDIRFETPDLKDIHENIQKALEKYKGYVSNENEFNESDRISHSITVRVPADNFQKFLSDISKGVKHFDSKNINTQDVTEEYIDVEARIKTKKELESRYLALLNKANSIKDMLEIEAQLNAIRSDIESIEGRLKYLSSQTSYSTLTINYYQYTTQFNGFGSRISQNFKEGWNHFIDFILGLVRIWWVIFIVLPAIYYLNKLRKRIFSSRKTS